MTSASTAAHADRPRRPAHIHAALERRRDELRSRYVQLSRALRRVRDPLSRSLDGPPLEVENEEVLARLEQSTRQELEQVLGALERIDSGEFGRCAVCSGQISDARLTAVPTTRLCIACAEELEL